MKKRIFSGILVVVSGLAVACGDEKDASKSEGNTPAVCEASCSNDKAVACDADGHPSETPCVNGCDADGKSCKTCVASCSGSKQITCDSAGKIVETSCPNGCDADGKSCKTCVAGCSNDTQIACDSAGKIVETSCPNGCDADGKSCKECIAGCSNDTQIACDSAGKIVETPCINGCDDDGESCKECVAGCIDGSQITCDSAGKIVETPCVRGCDASTSVCAPDNEEYKAAKTSCTTFERYCIDAHTAFECSDYNNWEGGIDPYIEHCGANRVCTGGVCVIQNSNKCGSDYCKDLHTLVTCVNGKATETPCGSGKKCFDRACRNDTNVVACSSSDDCDAATETCYNGFCYVKADLELAEGEACAWNGFKEYCKDGKEYKCGDDDYNPVVFVNDCGPYNGCTTVVQKAYQKDYAVLNATCRGNTDELSACTQAGSVMSRCYNFYDPDFPVYMSLTSVCVPGSDGEMYFAIDRDQVACTSPCDEATGFCAK